MDRTKKVDDFFSRFSDALNLVFWAQRVEEGFFSFSEWRKVHFIPADFVCLHFVHFSPLRKRKNPSSTRCAQKTRFRADKGHSFEVCNRWVLSNLYTHYCVCYSELSCGYSNPTTRSQLLTANNTFWTLCSLRLEENNRSPPWKDSLIVTTLVGAAIIHTGS